jgi:2-keto-4-pentenoate hydratase/2-oxohepta-3-ene-1,7-dioic acid hydratase in catechol pathway
MAESEWPIAVVVASASVSGPFDPIVLPRAAPDQVDYEGEVAVVIGRSAKDVPEETAWEHVFGLTAANDVSARDVQIGRYFDDTADHAKAKGFDTFKPIGPWIATPEEYEDPTDVGLRTWVDGELRQEGRTGDMMFPVATCVSFISRFTTLLPGDVIVTGTPGGVGMSSIGEHENPFKHTGRRVRPPIGQWVSTLEGAWLRPGSVVRVEVEGAGAIENPVVSA